MPSPIVLNLYHPETEELEKSLSRSIVPWKMLKKAIRLQKQLASKPTDQFEEADIDALTTYIAEFFGNGLTVEILDEQSDVTEMMTVIRAIVNRAKGVMDPTLPLKAST